MKLRFAVCATLAAISSLAGTADRLCAKSARSVQASFDAEQARALAARIVDPLTRREAAKDAKRLAPFLHSRDQETRSSAIEALSRLSSSTLEPHLYSALRDAPAEHRLAIRLLIEHHCGTHLRSQALVVDGLESPNAHERALAAGLLARCRTPADLRLSRAAITCATDEDARVRSLVTEFLRRAPQFEPTQTRRLLAVEGMAVRALGLAARQEAEGVPTLVAALEQPALQHGALRCLANVGPAARTALPKIRELFDPKHSLYHVALIAMLYIDRENVETQRLCNEYLRRRLDGDASGLSKALTVLGRLGSGAAEWMPKAIARAHSSSDSAVHRSFAFCCQLMGPHAKDAVPLLRRYLQGNVHLRASATMALREIGRDARAAIGDLAMLAESGRNSGAVEALCRIVPGSEAQTAAQVLVVAERQASQENNHQGRALWAALWPHSKARILELYAAGDSERRVAEATLRYVARQNPDALLSFAATAEAQKLACLPSLLGLLQQRREEAVRILTALLDDKEHRLGALYALAGYGELAAPAFETVRRLVDNDERLMEAAWPYFASVGPRAVPVLTRLLGKGPQTRMWVMHALERHGAEAAPALEKLAELAQADRLAEAEHAGRVVIAMGRPGLAFLAGGGEREVLLVQSRLPRLLEHADQAVQRALWALAARRQKLGDIALESIASTRRTYSGNRELRRNIVSFAGSFGSKPQNAKSVHSILLDGLLDPDIGVRRRALQSSAQCRSQALLPWIAGLIRDEDASVRAQAAHSLARFGADASPYRAALIALRDDSHESVRHAAKKALERIPERRGRD